MQIMVNEVAETHSSPQRLSTNNEEEFLSLTQINQTLPTIPNEKRNVSPLQSPPITPTPVRSPIPVSPSAAKPIVLMFDPLMNAQDVQTSESNGSVYLSPKTPYLTSPTQIQGYEVKSLVSNGLNRNQSDDRERHLATLGTELNQSAVHNKHKKWGSFDTSALKSSNLLGLMGKGVRDRGIKSQPHTPKITDKKKISSSMLTSPPIEIMRSLQMTDFTSSFASLNSDPGAMKQKDLLDSIFNLAPVPSKRVPDTSFLNNESTTSFAGAYQTKLRTSEIEPSPHQIELPAYRDVMIFARLCDLKKISSR